MAETTTLEWSPSFSLKWSDFKAESNPAVFEDSHSVIKYKFTWTVNSEKINDDDVVFFIENIRVFPEFHPLLSWVRESEASDILLHHEQAKFDLAKLVLHENISKLEDKFYPQHYPTRGQNDEQRKQYAKEDSGLMINEEVEKLQKLFDDRCVKYHEETNFGHDSSAQSKYDELINKIK